MRGEGEGEGEGVRERGLFYVCVHALLSAFCGSMIETHIFLAFTSGWCTQSPTDGLVLLTAFILDVPPVNTSKNCILGRMGRDGNLCVYSPLADGLSFILARAGIPATVMCGLVTDVSL